MKIYQLKNHYLPAGYYGIYLEKGEKNARIMVFDTLTKWELVSEEMPLELAEKVFNKIGDHLSDSMKTVVDIDLIIEKMTQYENAQKNCK